ncbi:PKD domain-containing protein, partial [Candidatus Amoebophilus asiaticus]|nr:PKD domain-containing protein [Candidatus Amoebophilus asiaticus]
GYFIGSVTFGTITLNSAAATDYDMFVVKYDANGNVLWANNAGGTNNDYGYSVVTDGNDDIIVVGGFKSNVMTFDATNSITNYASGLIDVFIVKYNQNGVVTWVQGAGGTDADFAHDVSIDGNNNIFLTGLVQSNPATFGSIVSTPMAGQSNKDIFTTMYNQNGNAMWVQRSGGTVNEMGRGIAADANGNVTVTGWFQTTAIFSSADGNHVSLTAFDNIQDIFVIRYDVNGNLQWAQQAGDNNSSGGGGYFGDEQGFDVEMDAGSNAYVVGWFSKTAQFGTTFITANGGADKAWDIFVAKYNSTGGLDWVNNVGGTGVDNGYGVTLDPSDNVTITGRTKNGNFDVMLAKYDVNGTMLWQETIDATGDAYGLGIEADGICNTFIGGMFQGSLTLGNDTYTSTSVWNAFSTNYIIPAANAGTDQTICAGQSATIGATGFSGYNYAWRNNPNGNGNAFSTTSSTNVTPDATKTYYLTVDDPTSTCVNTDSVTITVIPLPAVNFNYDSTMLCKDSTVQFTNLSKGTNLTYLWEFGDGATSTATDPVHAYAAAGTYQVKLTATDAVNNCVNDTTIPIVIDAVCCIYQIANYNAVCGDTFCIALEAIQAVDAGIIGMDYCMGYDPTVMTPTGNATLGDVVLDGSINADFYINHTTFSNEIHTSIFYTSNAPAGSQFTGQGEIICIGFVLNTGIAEGTTYSFSACEIVESYTLSDKNKCGIDGRGIVVQDTLDGKIIFWNDNTKPLRWDANNAGSYLVTNIYGSNDVNKLNPTQTDLSGDFKYTIDKGTSIIINRDIAGDATTSTCTDVMQYINGMDCYLIGQVTTLDNSLMPNEYQMIAADVNMNDEVHANDITLIQDRTIMNICEYPQAWNYTAGTTANPQSNGELSLDWRFIDDKSLQANADYLISSSYPADDGTGFWRDNVPEVPSSIAVELIDVVCPTIVDDSYHGILLGDVDGNWDDNASSAGLKFAATGEVIFDLTRVTTLGDRKYLIPVYFDSNDEIVALDFSMDYDENKIKIASIMSSMDARAANINVGWNNFKEDMLLLSSYTMSGISTKREVYLIEVTTTEENILAEDLGSIKAYLNGKRADATVKFDEETEGLPIEILNGKKYLYNSYPNPANDYTTFEYNLGDEFANNAVIVIYNVLGKSIESHVLTNQQGRLHLDTSTMENGMYFTKLLFGNKVIDTKKFTVIH